MSEYLSREAVDDVLIDLSARTQTFPLMAIAVAMAIDKIDSLPSADVAPVIHAHWSKEMRFTEDFMGNRTYGYKCSVCGKLANRLQFCGSCGAKMDESEDSGNEN